MRNILMKQLKLCLVTNIKGDLKSYSETVRRAALGGITMVQLREKHHDINHIKKSFILKKHLKAV